MKALICTNCGAMEYCVYETHVRKFHAGVEIPEEREFDMAEAVCDSCGWGDFAVIPLEEAEIPDEDLETLPALVIKILEQRGIKEIPYLRGFREENGELVPIESYSTIEVEELKKLIEPS